MITGAFAGAAPAPSLAELLETRGRASEAMQEAALLYAAAKLLGATVNEALTLCELKRAGRAYGDADQAYEFRIAAAQAAGGAR